MSTFTPTAEQAAIVAAYELGDDVTIVAGAGCLAADTLINVNRGGKGSAQTIKHVAYQSQGVQEGQAVVGGRYMATGTVEYVHWLNDKWGAAAFVDVGDASDSSADWKANQSYGVGARFKTPAGPLGLDLAYAEQPRKFRLSFSVTVAF